MDVHVRNRMVLRAIRNTDPANEAPWSPMTVTEIVDYLKGGLSASQVRAALKALDADGAVTQMGVASGGGKTWAVGTPVAQRTAAAKAREQ